MSSHTQALAANLHRTFDLLLLHGGSEVLVLVRNVILARCLGVEEFGLLTMLALSLRLVEMLTDFSVERLLISSRHAASIGFQASVHGFSLARGGVVGVLLAICAPTLAVFFAQPELALVIAFCGLAPVLKGFAHSDAKLRQRDMDFRSAAWVELNSHIVAITACFAVLLFRADVWVGAAGILGHAIGQLVVSHRAAVRKYYVRFSRRHFKEIAVFGWPLAVNGLLMFAILQGDKLVVAASVTVEELATFSVAMQLALLPALMLNRIANSVLLPLLSKQRQQCNSNVVAQEAMHVLTLVGALLAISTILCLNSAIQVIYGADFLVAQGLVVAIALCQLFRAARVVPAVAAVAAGRSSIPLKVNCVRLSGLALAIAAASFDGDLVLIATAGAIGEFFALAIAVYYLSQLSELSVFRLVAEHALVLSLVLFCVVGSLSTAFIPAIWFPVLLGVPIHCWLVAKSVWRSSRLFNQRSLSAPLSNNQGRPQACH